jgi:hypothetical protein
MELEEIGENSDHVVIDIQPPPRLEPLISPPSPNDNNNNNNNNGFHLENSSEDAKILHGWSIKLVRLLIISILCCIALILSFILIFVKDDNGSIVTLAGNIITTVIVGWIALLQTKYSKIKQKKNRI